MRKVIDYLGNLFTPEHIQEVYVEGSEQEQFNRVNRGEGLRGYEPDAFVDYLDGHGIERFFVSAMKAPDPWAHGWTLCVDAAEVAAAARQCPDRVYGLYGCDPRARMPGLAEFEHYVRNEGFRGLHIHPHGSGLPPNHAYYFPWYAKCVELDVPCVISMGTTLALLSIEVARPVYLDDVALYFPELKLVCAHTGWPWVEEAIAVAWKHENVFLGTSAHAPRYWKKEMVDFANARRGRHKVMFGTDWPLIQHREALEQIEQLGLRDETIDALLYGNAARVFGFEE
jgi:predicted TIM-barrel fold metal-dependent hydrolase